ncbi:MAG: hypothetical protein PHS59_00700 [Paludibacter sp.]|nr:hypothetical protein [Paludibacter sp.]
MKTTIPYILLLLTFSLFAKAQEIINNEAANNIEAIRQISVSDMDIFLSFQSWNNVAASKTISKQIGNYNKLTINQYDRGEMNMVNKAFTTQTGNSNELTLGQIGSNNLLLAYQMGYQNTADNTNKMIEYSYSSINCSKTTNVNQSFGGGNKLDIAQEGTDNVALSFQQGTDNTFVAKQTGRKNYLMVLQRGTSNSVSGFNQENQTADALLDVIIQVGDNLELKTDEFARSKTRGNSITQTGTNLSLELSNEILNNKGGLEVSQKGNDMKVIVDQSYFAFPLK